MLDFDLDLAGGDRLQQSFQPGGIGMDPEEHGISGQALRRDSDGRGGTDFSAGL